MREKVAITRIQEDNVEGAVRQAIDLLGGIEQFVPPGSRVLVKPAIYRAPARGGITHPEAVRGVLRWLNDGQPGEVMVGECAADCHTPQAFRLLGYYEIARQEGAQCVDLNFDEAVRLPSPPDSAWPHVTVSKQAYEADVRISLPTFKIWSTPMSLSLKNLMGLLPGRYYGWNRDSHQMAQNHPDWVIPDEMGTEEHSPHADLSETVYALNCAVPSTLTIIDAIEASDGAEDVLKLDLIIAGANALATDVVALAVAGFDPVQDYTPARKLYEKGFGPLDPAEIEVLGERIKDVQFDLRTLRQGVTYRPVDECLRLLSTAELQITAAQYQRLNLQPVGNGQASREELLEQIAAVLEQPSGIAQLEQDLSPGAQDLLDLLKNQAGTHQDFYDLEKEFARHHEGYSFNPSLRQLTRLALAVVVPGRFHPYVLLPETHGV